MDETRFKGKKINYSIQGKGKSTIILIHGYLESLDIWEEFSGELSRDYTVIRPDLPGHGKSEVIQDIHYMELMAEAMNQILEENHIESATIVGHSMGGYAALAFVDLYPEKVERFCLFHSHPFPDTPQVKENREKAIENVRSGKKEEIIKSHVPKTFADDNLKAFEQQIEWATEIVLETPEEGIIANLKGMMERPDKSQLVKNSDKPFLLIAGKKDNFIDYNTVIPKIELPEKGELLALDNSGHMGFIEEKESSLKAIQEFMNKK
jgi:pimeloyl-ACP methyl ester carboxylesterase